MAITKTEQRKRIRFRAKEVERYIEQHQEAEDRAKLREKTRVVYVPTWPIDPDKAEEFFGEPAPPIDE